ncbi:Growth-regulating factor 4 [Camellia lanceoleosa]|uniref:Growth-regulating factor 4 n=1 Tax=Camellia lanceoleosa TaxID=1840588 RepID=A0ACC0G204_9ERIC|nr:Growth-regulating factor 4 [Camellia lanceoleosa]
MSYSDHIILLKEIEMKTWPLFANSNMQDFESMNNAAMTRQRQQQQHYLFGSEIGSPEPVKQESHAIRPFFDDWPKARDSWSELDDQRYDKNTFSTT